MKDSYAKDFITELRYDLKVKDPIKARYVLNQLDLVDKETQINAIAALSRAPGDFVIPLLVEVLAVRPDLAEICPLLKEVLLSKAIFGASDIVSLLEAESNTAKKIILTEIAGKIRIKEASPILVKFLNLEKDQILLKHTIKALGMIGDPPSVSQIAEYLYSWNSELMLTAIHALGRIETPEAFERLAGRLGSDRDVDTIILEVFSLSQTPEAIEKLTEALSSRYAHIRNEAKKRLIHIAAKSVPFLLKNLSVNNSDTLVHTLNALGIIGDESAILPIRRLLHSEPEDPNVRFAAYEALGSLPVEKGAITLAEGLEDPESSVRSAAAKVIDHNYNPLLSAGIKNLVREGGTDAEGIIRTFIDSQCDNIFLDLIFEESFSAYAFEYLNRRVHPDIKNYFLSLLKENGLKDKASMISKKRTRPEGDVLKVFAVDDSKMILGIYRTVLNNLGCRPLLFEYPADALTKLGEEKPDVILTDLNMPDISGIELTRNVRELYGKEEMPVIMVTTQNESNDHEEAYKAGVNAIIHKPFNEDQIWKVLTQFVNLSTDISEKETKLIQHC